MRQLAVLNFQISLSAKTYNLYNPCEKVQECSRTIHGLVHEVQMAGSRTSVLELVLELVQELVHEVQMAGSRTSVLELVLELVLRVPEPVQELKFYSRTGHLYFMN